MSKKNSHKDRVGIVYSTASDFDYTTDQEEEADTLPANQQVLKIFYENKGRGGKQVTLVKNFIGTNADLETLGKKLKAHCGTGGSVKDGEILIQGDLRPKVAEFLRKQGYQVKGA
ncbi:MAG: translation initiation factor [Imperialibacter sp.]|uniref:translation initiation factor n=1 Tax=Imperialibacter sp. TaxID=2038411 RepID=UPI0032EAA224